MDETSILKEALDLWGYNLQLDVLIEEMAELTKAIIKARRSGDPGGLSWDVLNELVDVDICIKQLHLMFELQTSKEILEIYEMERTSKIERLKKRINEVRGNVEEQKDEQSAMCDKC
jgi:hypothetical protein